MVEAVRDRAGISWRAVLDRCGEGHKVPPRFRRWAERGVWVKCLTDLADNPAKAPALREATLLRAQQHRAGAHEGTGGKQRLGAHLHTTGAALGHPIRCPLTSGQVHELAGAEVLGPVLTAQRRIADEVDARGRTPHQKAGETLLIPPGPLATYDVMM